MSPELEQIHLGIGSDGFEPVREHGQNLDTYVKEQNKLQEALFRRCPREEWPRASNELGCPRPILVQAHHQRMMTELHDALTIAITDVVQRWWTDTKADFPRRMPVEPEEEELLKWVEGQVALGNLPDFSECRGSWRPDFMVDDTPNEDGDVVENYRITEINARYSFNGFMHESYGQQALDDHLLELGDTGLMSATDGKKIFEGLLGLFDPNLPLHLLHEHEFAIDMYMFVDAVHRRFGLRPRMIKPSTLRVIKDEHGATKLCCTIPLDGDDERQIDRENVLVTPDGELVEEVHQIGLEAKQWELLSLDQEVLHAVTLRCFNDMRTVFLVHDKRMLGIVKQEIPSLVGRGVLTTAQGGILDRGVADSVLPGSREMEAFTLACKQWALFKDQFILKPMRGGKGVGILFGEDMGAEEWMAALRKHTVPGLALDESCVVQRRIIPRVYDLILKSTGKMVRFPLVGTYHVVNGELLGLGTWRSSGDHICAVSSGGAWICSVMPKE